ncbi:hypothetical protein ACLOJK_011773 [Asimina triloba]
MPADPKATQTHQASKKELFCAGSSGSLSRENVDGSVRRPIGSPDKREVLSSDSWLECGENGGEGDGEEEKQYLSQPGPTLMGNGDGGVGGEEDAGEAKSILPMLLPIRNMKEIFKKKFLCWRLTNDMYGAEFIIKLARIQSSSHALKIQPKSNLRKFELDVKVKMHLRTHSYHFKGPGQHISSIVIKTAPVIKPVEGLVCFELV